jgi:hypothetical protein
MYECAQIYVKTTLLLIQIIRLCLKALVLI